MNDIWIDTRLQPEEMDFLWNAISESTKESINYNHALVGNISKSELVKDNDNWFYKSALKKLAERLFYDDWNNYRKYHIVKEEPQPKFEMNSFWVNYQKQHEFNPPHNHDGLYSFVVFMKIPTHWKDQHALLFSVDSKSSRVSDFQFLLGHAQGQIRPIPIPLCPKDEGRMLFFPAWLMHQVFPFFGTEEERVTLSGNIVLQEELGTDTKEVMLEKMEKQVEYLKEVINRKKKFTERN